MAQVTENTIGLVFKDIDVHIENTKILNKVCGMVKQGEMLALMGSNGSGKSTLLHALAGRSVISNGKVMLKGEMLSKELHHKVAFVQQDDVFLSNLTLRETLNYSSKLRLPDKMPHTLRDQRVEELINMLQLTESAKSVMGSLSGCEKKLASIATELLTSPSVLLIDEPTSGLDYASAYHIMKIIKDYTKTHHKASIVSIQQPTSQIFHMFDNLLLLVNGQVGYFGEASNVMDFFSDLVPHYNPADFILEEITQNSEIADAVIEKSRTMRKTDWPKLIRGTFVKPQDGFVRLDTRHQISLKSGGYLETLNKEPTTVILENRPVEQDGENSSGTPAEIVVENNNNNTVIDTDSQIEALMDRGCQCTTGFWTQYKTLTIRSMKQARHRILSRINIIQAVVITIIASIVWFRSEHAEQNIHDRMGMLFFAFVYWGFITMIQAVDAFPEEKTLVDRERTSGIYRLSTYYLAKQSSELSLALILPFGYMFLFYWCAGLSYTAIGFFSVMFTILLTVLIIQGIGFLFGIIFTDSNKSQVTGALFMLASMLCGGFLQRHYTNWTAWLKYISVCHYIFDSLIFIEFGYGYTLKCLPVNQTFFASCLQSKATTVSRVELLHIYNIIWPIWAYYIILVVFWLIIPRILGYIILRFTHKPICSSLVCHR